jgi:hypothetical protein
MKRIPLILFFLFTVSLAWSQYNLSDSSFSEGETINDAFGNFSFQYNRIISKDTANPASAFVTIVFINGNAQTAIQYRQEFMNSNIEWIKTDDGTPKKEKFVDALTTSIPPNNILTWQFKISAISKNNKNIFEVEKAALLIMNDNYQVTKKIFLNHSFLKN